MSTLNSGIDGNMCAYALPVHRQNMHTHVCITDTLICMHVYTTTKNGEKNQANLACLITIDTWKSKWNATESGVESEISVLHIHSALFSL